MAKKRSTSRKKTSARRPKVDATDKQLVIVESPSKARTINKYLGDDYVVLASVGHVRDLPRKKAKGDKSPVPAIALDRDFEPHYEVLADKKSTVAELRKAARQASEVWFATDLDREGEAIAWHLAEVLGVNPETAKRVIFSAITRTEIKHAFDNPRPIDMDRVNAQQARRILDRIVGYQVSPLLWKKVARGLSAGRVQSVAMRLVVDREREIRAFVPDESWQIHAAFQPGDVDLEALAASWQELNKRRDDKGKPPARKELNAWLSEQGGLRGELVEVDGEKFELTASGNQENPDAELTDLTARVREIAGLAGLDEIQIQTEEDERGRGPARFRHVVTGQIDSGVPWKVVGIETRRNKARASAPFITSSLQAAASTRIGFAARRTMRTAQSLYEGVDIPGEGPVGLITYMRTDSTHIAGEALQMARDYISTEFGPEYLPEKPNFFGSTNKAAQEAHEAIRPTSLRFAPEQLRGVLTPDQFKLYRLIWERFVSCQMNPAEWDNTSIFIEGGRDESRPLRFKGQGRTLVFDGYYRVAGIPTASDEQTLPALSEGQALGCFGVEPRQRFSSPPPRYSEASLIKMLESEGIGRPSTYADIIQKIQDRKYVEQIERRFLATDLGEVVTDKLIEAFPQLMEVRYTRQMEGQLDRVEEEHLDWIEMLHNFYEPFQTALEHAMENLSHAKAETVPAPDEYRCGDCGSPTMYRFGKNGKFLSCSAYPDCKWASPIDREGRPQPAEFTRVACPKCDGPMIKRSGRFGVFLGCARYRDDENPCDGILNLDKKSHKVTAPTQPPYVTELECEKCGSPMNLRHGARGPWLGCSRFPKCRGRMAFTKLDEKVVDELKARLAKHMKAHPIPIIKTLDGIALTDATGKALEEAPKAEELLQN